MLFLVSSIYNLEGRRKSIVLKKYNLEETRKTMHCLKKIQPGRKMKEH
jgi:hypothetical protein